jgi:hypothetical protein
MAMVTLGDGKSEVGRFLKTPVENKKTAPDGYAGCLPNPQDIHPEQLQVQNSCQGASGVLRSR